MTTTKPGTVCPGSGRKWGSGTVTPICPQCRRGPKALKADHTPKLRKGRWTGKVPTHEERTS